MKQLNLSDDIVCEWEDVMDVLGFLNEKVNQFEWLFLEIGGLSKLGLGLGYFLLDFMIFIK